MNTLPITARRPAGLDLRLLLLLSAFVAYWPVPAVSQLSAERPLGAETAAVLNSERIESLFGSYGIEVVSSEARLRVSNLFSKEREGRVTRTFAVVRFPEQAADAYSREHALILGGASIGATFKQSGWDVIKTHLDFGELPVTPRLRGMMRLEGSPQLAVHIYRLSVARGDEYYDYATIAEVHHPQYLDLQTLIAIYAPGWMPPSAPDEIGMEVKRIAARQMR